MRTGIQRECYSECRGQMLTLLGRADEVID
jgi:hypothetical protein